MSVFLKAIDVINERGWVKGRYGHIQGPVCLIGACAVASDLEPGKFERSLAYDALFRATATHAGEKHREYWLPHMYNDASTTTQEDIIDVLREAHAYECERVAQTEQSSAPPA